MMTQNLLAIGAGLFVGLLFAGLKLPLPAPPTLTGILGAFGVFLGSVLYRLIASLLA
ncbi:MAG TPA: XapX domain-containing protein [Bordetella sp.]